MYTFMTTLRCLRFAACHGYYLDFPIWGRALRTDTPTSSAAGIYFSEPIRLISVVGIACTRSRAHPSTAPLYRCDAP